MTKRLVFPGEKSVELETFTVAKPGPREVLVKNHYSLMSTGTENIVFNRLFAPGTHWDKWVEYPFYPGYAAVGEVVAVGAEVSSVKEGQLVAHRGGHASDQIQDENQVFVLPKGVEPRDAVWLALAKISFMGARAANYFLGDSVLIVGAGPIGQCSVRWAKSAGCSEIICVDMVKSRLELAMTGGASHTYAQALSDELKEDVTKVLNGKQPDIVIDTTGNAAVFSECLKFAKRQGKVVVLGDTGNPERQHLSSEVILGGLQIIGAHDGLSEGEWAESRIFDLFFNFLRTGRFNMSGMNTHEFKPENCAEAYRTANERRGETMGILFDWRI